MQPTRRPNNEDFSDRLQDGVMAALFTAISALFNSASSHNNYDLTLKIGLELVSVLTGMYAGALLYRSGLPTYIYSSNLFNARINNPATPVATATTPTQMKNR